MPSVMTARLEVKPLPSAAAEALPHSRQAAAVFLGAKLHGEWPHSDLVDALPLLGAASEGDDHFGIWVMIERDSGTVVGDVGFHGPPDEEGTVEIGYSVISDRRGRGYATEAAGAMIAWANLRPNVKAIVAGCDSDNAASVRTLERMGFGQTDVQGGRISWRLDVGPQA